MRSPPPLSALPRYPVTGGIGLLALVATLAWWKGIDISLLELDAHLFEGQVWRVFTSALPHVDLMHLFFNLYWLWAIGTLFEERLGGLKLLGICLIVAAGSALWEFTFLDGGVGLSGVGYGLFGLLWVLDRRDPRFRGEMDRNTLSLFVVWFFACIVMTLTNVFPVANIAHGMGAVVGAALGYAMKMPRPAERRLAAAGVAALIVLGALGSTVLRPYVNRSHAAGDDLFRVGTEYLIAKDYRRAERYLEPATRMRHPKAAWWYNFGLDEIDLGKQDAGVAALKRAADLDPNSDEFRKAYEDFGGKSAGPPSPAGSATDSGT